MCACVLVCMFVCVSARFVEAECGGHHRSDEELSVERHGGLQSTTDTDRSVPFLSRLFLFSLFYFFLDFLLLYGKRNCCVLLVLCCVRACVCVYV